MNWDAFIAALWQQIVPLLATATLAVILALLGYLVRLVKLKVSSLKNESLQKLLEMLVAAAEQQLSGEQGEIKKAWVLSEFERRTGIQIDDALLESLVYKLKQNRSNG